MRLQTLGGGNDIHLPPDSHHTNTVETNQCVRPSRRRHNVAALSGTKRWAGGRNAILRREVARTQERQGREYSGAAPRPGRELCLPAGQGRIQSGGGAGPRAGGMKRKKRPQSRGPGTQDTVGWAPAGSMINPRPLPPLSIAAFSWGLCFCSGFLKYFLGLPRVVDCQDLGTTKLKLMSTDAKHARLRR